jgi:hypothetical protein
MNLRTRILAGVLLLAAAPPARAQVDGAKVNAAIDRGIDWLLRIQRLDGTWSAHEHGNYQSGPTALALLTLLKCGVPEGHPAVRRALAYLEAHPPRKTYSLGCYLMALHALKNPPREALERSVALLLETQPGSQYIAYPEGQGDLSCQQYAALGYKVALERGLEIPLQVFERLTKHLLRSQYEHGGFGYTPMDTPTGSMTAAGAACLLICKQAFEASGRGKAWLPQIEDGLRRAERWIEANWAGPSNPRPGRDPAEADGWQYYYLYGLERFGAFAKLEHFGKYPWYTIGAEWLLEKQEGNGRWPAPWDRQDEFDTCFALLFLRRASAPSTGSTSVRRFDDAFGKDDESQPLSIRGNATPDGQLQIWIARYGKATREQHEVERDGQRGLAVTRVEWLVDGALVGSHEHDPAKLVRDERFAHRRKVEANGELAVQARLHLLGRDGTPQFVTSPVETARLTILFATREQELCEAVAANLLRFERIESVSASTQIDDGWWSARSAVDQRHATGWRARAEDATPTLTLAFSTPITAQRLELSHVTPRPDATLDEWAAATKISVRINNTKPQLFDLGTARDRRHRIQLEKPARIRTLELAILERAPGKHGSREVGFQELELFAR